MLPQVTRELDRSPNQQLPAARVLRAIRAITVLADQSSLAFELALRLIACTAEFLFLRVATGEYLKAPERITLLLVVVAEVWTFGAMMLARPATRRDLHPLVVITMPFVFGYAALLDTTPATHLLPEWVCGEIEVVALIWVLYAKVSLGRSFGLLPADRGIIASGPYRWVRHPIYVGYFVIHLGFLLVAFHARNLLVFSTLYVIQIYRVLREERLLSACEEYRYYRRRVRYRLVLGVF